MRTIPASAFFTGYLSTALAPPELLMQVRFPAAAPGTGAAFTEFARRRGDFALHASGDYRRHLALVLARRAITRAVSASSG